MKRFLKFLLIFVLLFSLIGCAKASDNGNVGGGDTVPIGNDVTNQSQRIIVYRVNAEIKVKDLRTEVINIKKSLNNDEWIESEDQSDTKAIITLRIKTERLDDFILSLESKYDITNLKKTSKDLSLDYFDYDNRIYALNIQRERLLERIETATDSYLSELLKQLRSVEEELYGLQRKVTEIDTDVYYSAVTLTIYQKGSTAEKTGFFEKIWTTWKNIFVILFEILTFFIAILPVIAIIFLMIFIFNKISKKRKKEFNQKGTIVPQRAQEYINKVKEQNEGNK